MPNASAVIRTVRLCSVGLASKSAYVFYVFIMFFFENLKTWLCTFFAVVGRVFSNTGRHLCLLVMLSHLISPSLTTSVMSTSATRIQPNKTSSAEDFHHEDRFETSAVGLHYGQESTTQPFSRYACRCAVNVSISKHIMEAYRPNGRENCDVMTLWTPARLQIKWLFLTSLL